MEKIYYQIRLRQRSPLRIGNGDSQETDSDLMVDMRGYPFVPGSSLAGVLRTYLKPEEACHLFGELKDKEAIESRVSVSDAVIGTDAVEEMILVHRRDGVGLNDWGTAIDGSKYDFQVVETDEPYTAILEYTPETGEEDALDAMMQTIAAEGLSLGARTTRGYGSFQAEIRKKTFHFPEDLEKWIAFDSFAADAFEDAEDIKGTEDKTDGLQIRIRFHVSGGLNIRERTTSYEELDDGTIPDSLPLLNIDDKPVIPGTAWAGVFRHHMRDIIRELDAGKSREQEKEELEQINQVFGLMERADHRRSGIRFSESVIEGGEAVSSTRNAVERFTQAPKNTGLFTVRFWNGGTGELEIHVDKNAMNTRQKRILALAINDLQLGMLSVGGEAGIGRGRVGIDGITVNGVNCTESMRCLATDYLEVE